MRNILCATSILVAASLAPAAANDFAATEWKVAGGTVEQSISFSEAGRFQGFAGCNRVFGSYKSDSEKMKITVFGQTRKFCGEEIDRHERTFLSALKQTRYSVRKNRSLKFLDKSKEILIDFELRN